MSSLPIDNARRVRFFSWGGATALILLPLIGIKALDANAWQIEDLSLA
jgi:hypothetical protein